MHIHRLFFVVFSLQLLLISTTFPQFSTWRKQFTGPGLTLGLNPYNPNTIIVEGESDSLYFSFDGGKTWSARTPAGATSIRQIIVHPNDTNVIFAASGYQILEGLRRSTDYGQTWQTVIPNFGIDGESISYDLNHPDTMYAGNFNPGNTYRSTDRGATWTLMGDAGDYLCALDVRPDSSNIVYAGTSGGTISKSTNNGVTWRVVKAGTSGSVFQEVPKIVINPVNPLIAYSTTYGSLDTTLDVWKTTDGGEHWERTALQKIPTWALEIDKSNPEIIYAGTFSPNSAVIYKSTDGGASWQPSTSTLLKNAFMWSLKVHPMKPDVLWLSATSGTFGVNGIYRSVTTNTVIEGAVLDASSGDTVKNGYILVPSSGDSIELAQTAGTFQLGNFEGDSLMPYALFASYPYYLNQQQLQFEQDTTISVTVTMQRLPRISYTGEIRDEVNHNPVSAEVRLNASTLIGDSVNVITTVPAGNFQFDSIYIEYPPINSYTLLTVNPDLPYAQELVQAPDISTPTTVDVSVADLLLLQDSGSGNYHSFYTTALHQLGLAYSHWDAAKRGIPNLSSVPLLSKKSIIYFYGTKSDAMSQEMKNVLISALDDGARILFAGQNFVEKNDTSVLLTQYLGTHFVKNTSVAFCKGATGELFHPLSFFTTGPGGANNQSSRDELSYDTLRGKDVMWYGSSVANGVSAVAINNTGTGGRAIVMGFGLEAIIPDTMRRNIVNRVINYFDSASVVGVNDENDFLPGGIHLYQNYPNPFNPSTAIQYQMPGSGYVTLKIYNVLGEEVATLVDGFQVAGLKSVRWDASGFAGGVYYYQIRAGEYVAAKKMLLIR